MQSFKHLGKNYLISSGQNEGHLVLHQLRSGPALSSLGTSSLLTPSY
jgi:hypothetical protein